MKQFDTRISTDRYVPFCQLFILILPLHGISFFDIGFHGSPDNILIILSFLLLTVDYLIFDDIREYINGRLFSKEAGYLILLLILMLMFDIINVIYYGNPGFLADRMGSILLLVFFACGISTREHIRKIAFCWMLAASYLALQNILSNMGITPVIEGSRFHDPRVMYGVKMPFHYGAGLPGAFGWHGMMLISGFIFSCYVYNTNRLTGFICALLCSGSIVMMQSRSTYLGFLASVVILIFFMASKNSRRGLWIIVLSPLFIVIAAWHQEIFFFFQYAWHGFVAVAEGTMNKRLLQFQLAIDIGLNHPLIGTGHNSFSTISNLPYTIHNSFLYQLVSLGVASFLFYCLAFVLAFVVSFRNMLPHRLETIPGINPFLFCALVGITIELNCFLVISGRIPWLIIYFILLTASLGADNKIKGEGM